MTNSEYDKKKFELNDWVNWAWDDWDEYAFGEWTEFVIPTITHNIWPKTNQWMNTETKSACTIVWSINQIIRLFWLDMEYKESNELGIEAVNYCTKYWYKIWSWWSAPTAIDAVCKYWNEVGYKKYNTEKVFYVRYPSYTHEKAVEAINKWHLVWFTYMLNYWDDRYKWLVYKDSYPVAVWHRTNWKATKHTKATWWASWTWCDIWVHDSYYKWTNEYFIKDRKKYIGKWMNAPAYLILPQSTMTNSVEEEKKRIAQEKALNTLLWALTTTYGDVPEEIKWLSAQFAKVLREKFPEVRWLIEEQQKKSMQSCVDMLSYNYKYADEKYQKKFADLAAEMRKDFGLK